jgi:tRNA-uridine 2-sulfurtransferase
VAGPVVWTSGSTPAGPVECEVQLRAHGMTSPAVVELDGDGLTARLRVPQRGVAAGQAIVLYAGDAVLGSATINAARRTVAA